jgi:hypothetical protein
MKTRDISAMLDDVAEEEDEDEDVDEEEDEEDEEDDGKCGLRMALDIIVLSSPRRSTSASEFSSVRGRRGRTRVFTSRGESPPNIAFITVVNDLSPVHSLHAKVSLTCFKDKFPDLNNVRISFFLLDSSEFIGG